MNFECLTSNLILLEYLIVVCFFERISLCSSLVMLRDEGAHPNDRGPDQRWIGMQVNARYSYSNTQNSVKRPTNGYENRDTNQTLIFFRYLDGRESLNT